MAVFLANVLLFTGRATRNSTTLQTSTEGTYLKHIIAHIEPNTPGPGTPVGSAIDAKWYATVDSGTDIVRGDTITAITLFDGTTPWPGVRPGPATQMPGVPGASNVTIRVVDAREASPGLLPYREVWIDYSEGGGPTSFR